jgi:2-oxoglutarate/2-oxoacid ferredoxin oxidoreductase subunit alpha
MPRQFEVPPTVSVAVTGAGGVGAVTAAQILLIAAEKAGCYGLMTRSSGPQVRGGESLACVRLGVAPVDNLGDFYDVFLVFDWANIAGFSAEVPLNADSLVVFDPASGEVPEIIRASGARCVELPAKKMAKELSGGRVNMVGLGALAALIGLPVDAVRTVLDKVLGRKGADAVEAAHIAVDAGFTAAGSLEAVRRLDLNGSSGKGERWSFSGNEAAGYGSLRAGVRFVAAYPITPSSDALEWMAPSIEKLGGHLIQAEDELASINMIVGASFGGIPSMTATSGPGLGLMTEGIGLAVAAEIPVVILNVMRGGPSSGVPTKSEQSDLETALYAPHGDAPHLVTAANSVADCLFTAEWTVYLAETLQSPAILLSDQALGQSRSITDRPADATFVARREEAGAVESGYERYAVTESGVSPMAIPGTPGCEYIAACLEHTPTARPSSRFEDHKEQLDKRDRKLTDFDYGEHWAMVEDADAKPDIAVVTWGSSTGPAREAMQRAAADGINARLISLRLLAPALTERFAEAIEGVERVLVVEQSHSRQFHRYLRAHYDLPKDVKVFSQPGPLPIRPGQIHEQLRDWN